MKGIILTAVLLSATLIALPTPHSNNSIVTTGTAVTVSDRNIRNEGSDKSKQATVAVNEQQKTANPNPQPADTIDSSRPLSDKEQLMQQAGIPENDWGAVDYIVTHESSWNAQATNTDSGAFGLCQALPAAKMASAGADYRSNPVTQLRWCHDYAMTRYSGWWSAFAFWKAERWW